MKDQEKNRFNLEEYKKETIFKAPEGYFEDLPQVIQSRIIAEDARKQVSWLPVPKLALQYALPALLIMLMATFFLVRNSGETLAPAEIIAQVEDESILYYLENEIDISTEDILESVPREYFEEDFGSITDGMEEINVDSEMLEKYGIEQDLVF